MAGSVNKVILVGNLRPTMHWAKNKTTRTRWRVCGPVSLMVEVLAGFPRVSLRRHRGGFTSPPSAGVLSPGHHRNRWKAEDARAVFSDTTPSRADR
jgi:hypothetical protein